LIEPLKECDFLNTIAAIAVRSPGGHLPCSDLPDYGYWLLLPPTERRRQLEDWTSRLRPICDAVAEVLWLTREATEAAEQVASGGLFQHSFRRRRQPSLVRDPATGKRRHVSGDSAPGSTASRFASCAGAVSTRDRPGDQGRAISARDL